MSIPGSISATAKAEGGVTSSPLLAVYYERLRSALWEWRALRVIGRISVTLIILAAAVMGPPSMRLIALAAFGFAFCLIWYFLHYSINRTINILKDTIAEAVRESSGPKLDDSLTRWENQLEKGNGVEKENHLEKKGSDLRLMSWGDGSGVPTSGNDLVIVGIDNNGLLHIKVFDPSGKLVTDSDETQLPPAQARAISSLKQQLPGLLPPHVLTSVEKAQVISEATSIVGQTQKKSGGEKENRATKKTRFEYRKLIGRLIAGSEPFAWMVALAIAFYPLFAESVERDRSSKGPTPEQISGRLLRLFGKYAVLGDGSLILEVGTRQGGLASQKGGRDSEVGRGDSRIGEGLIPSIEILISARRGRLDTDRQNLLAAEIATIPGGAPALTSLINDRIASKFVVVVVDGFDKKFVVYGENGLREIIKDEEDKSKLLESILPGFPFSVRRLFMPTTTGE